MGKLVVLRERAWWVPRPARMVIAATSFPKIKPLVVAGSGVITGWSITLASWFGGLPLAPKIGIGVGAGLVAAGVVGAVWHWVEARFVSDAAKRARLDALYYGTAVPALDQVASYWEFMQASDAEKFGPLLETLNGIVLSPVAEHRQGLEESLSNAASPPSAIIEKFRIVFQYHWRALLWIHATMGFVGVVPEEERYKAMIAAHAVFSGKMRRLAIQPGYRNLGKVRRTLNRERELIVTPWIVTYD